MAEPLSAVGPPGDVGVQTGVKLAVVFSVRSCCFQGLDVPLARTGTKLSALIRASPAAAVPATSRQDSKLNLSSTELLRFSLECSRPALDVVLLAFEKVNATVVFSSRYGVLHKRVTNACDKEPTNQSISQLVNRLAGELLG